MGRFTCVTARPDGARDRDRDNGELYHTHFHDLARFFMEDVPD